MTQKPSLPVHDNVAIYSKPNCVQCNATYREMDKHGLKYEVFDLTEDPETLSALRAHNHLQAPVVFIPDREPFTGFRPDIITDYAESLVAQAA